MPIDKSYLEEFKIKNDSKHPITFGDLVNVTIYPELDHELAMSIGDEFNFSQIYAYQLAEFCNKCGIKKMLLANQLKLLCKKVEVGLDNISLPDLAPFELEFWQKLHKSVLDKLKHFKAIVGDIVKMS